MAASSSSSIKVLPSLSGKLGIIEINNPKVFNSIDLEMVGALKEVLTSWHSSSIKGILIRSSKEARRPSFCAGGDVKRVYNSGIDASQGPHGVGASGVYTAEMFRKEFIVNHMMAAWDRPQISLWDGIVMGGGVGISIYGKYRVATENTVFAMPETGIGLFPDIGSMYWMTHMLDWSVASYLALSGARLRAPDLLYTGLATHYVPSEKLDELQKSLAEASESSPSSATVPDETDDVFQPVLDSFHQDLQGVPGAGGPTNANDAHPEGPFLATHAAILKDVFGSEDASMETIMARLKERSVGQDSNNNNNNKNGDGSFGSAPSQFSKDTLVTLGKMSPTSLKVTLEGLKRGKALPTLEDDLRMEFRMCQNFMKPGSDFYRGIRAVLVDKDNNPQWTPATLKDVTDEMVESYFAPLGENEWVLPRTSNL